MNLKVVLIILFAAVYAYRFVLHAVEKKSCANPIPECVSDVYDSETYSTWRKYSAEKLRVSLIQDVCTFVVSFVLLITNAYSAFAGLFGKNMYLQAFAVLMLDELAFLGVGIAISYVDDMKIEQKYGFNRKTLKTFWLDQIKSLIIELILSFGLTALLAAIHIALGKWVIVLFAAALFVIVMAISFLYPFLSRIFNKFTPLEDGELKDKLMALMTKNGYSVREIKVMDASRRSSKLNAYFTGFGKTKTIVLYDTLVEKLSTEEICAVFAHEMGHGLHKDTVKMQAMNIVSFALMALVIYLVLCMDSLYTAFGFEKLNYGFAFNIAGSVVFQLIQPLLGIFSSWYSRKAEYRADAQAVKEGYGTALKESLKHLARENFSHLAPAKLLVLLEYSHPPLADRISAIENAGKSPELTEK